MRYGWSIAAVLAYATLFGAFCLYVSFVDSDTVLTGPLAALAVLQVAVGLVLGWRAFFLLPLLVLLSIPVPVPQDAYEPMPMWFAMLYLGIPIAAVLMSVGVVMHVSWKRFRSTRSA